MNGFASKVCALLLLSQAAMATANAASLPVSESKTIRRGHNVVSLNLGGATADALRIRLVCDHDSVEPGTLAVVAAGGARPRVNFDRRYLVYRLDSPPMALQTMELALDTPTGAFYPREQSCRISVYDGGDETSQWIDPISGTRFQFMGFAYLDELRKACSNLGPYWVVPNNDFFEQHIDVFRDLFKVPQFVDALAFKQSDGTYAKVMRLNHRIHETSPPYYIYGLLKQTAAQAYPQFKWTYVYQGYDRNSWASFCVYAPFQ